MKVAIIGGGASGLMSAGTCALNGHEVDLFEANEKVGKKIYITGKGRCNVTNSSDNSNILNNVVNNSKFLYSSLNNFSSQDTINFFENLGVPIKIERGNRAFPQSDKSSDIIKALTRYCENSGVNILLNHKVSKIEKIYNKFSLSTTFGIYNNYDATIICTGGITYSATGSTGYGYYFAKSFGHDVTNVYPGLVPLLLKDDFVKDIEGLSLKNVKLISYLGNKKFKEFFGEMLFTKNAISGPIALTMSSYINKYEKSDIFLFLDLKPALTYEQINARIQRELDKNKNIQINTFLAGYMPKSLVSPFVNLIKLTETNKVKTLNSKDIENIINTLKNFPLNFAGVDKLDYGIITSGGINVNEINPKTMESKLVENLYFAGEVIDIDALTGGYNLQLAFATGYTAGLLKK